MQTRPRQSIGSGHQQVHAAVSHCAFVEAVALHLLAWVILIAESSLHSWLWLFDSLNMTWYSLFAQVIPAHLLLYPEAATSLPYRKCHSLMVAGINPVFQGKLCFPPLPVFYSFMPLNTCHTNWIRTPPPTLCPAFSLHTHHFGGTSALSHTCGAVHAT